MASSLPGPSAQPVLYVAGDIHHDGSSSVFTQFLDILARRPPQRLVILGDLFEYWLEEPAVARRHDEVLSRLRALARAGWRLDLVRGNRELVAGRMLESASACRLHWPALDLRLGSTRLRIVHGDRLVHDPGYRFFAAWMASFWWRAWIACLPLVITDAVALGMRLLSAGRQRPRPPSVRARVFIDRRKVQASARGIDTLIAGHIHESWRRRVGGVDLILVGDWPGDIGHWLEGYRDGRLERIRRNFSGPATQ